MTLIATRISDRCIDVDTPSGPLRITRDALTAAVRRLALDESCSTTVNVAAVSYTHLDVYKRQGYAR